MNKTLTIIRPGESHDDYSWALKLSDAERLSIADQLLRDLFSFLRTLRRLRCGLCGFILHTSRYALVIGLFCGWRTLMGTVV